MFYFIKDGVSNFFYNKLLHFLSVAIISAAFIFIIIIFLSLKNADKMLEFCRSEIPAYVYLSETANSIEKSKLNDFIGKSEYLKKSVKVSKKDALQEFKNYLSDYPELLDGISENPLPDYFEIYFKKGDLADRKDLKNWLAEFAAVESVEFGEQNIIKLSNIRYWLNKIFFGIIIFVCLLIVFISFCFINLLAYSQMNEIDIKKLIGVSRLGICLPFIFGALLIFLISSLLSMGVSYSIFIFFEKQAAALLSHDFIPVFLNYREIAVFISSVLIYSVISSYFSIRKFLKYTNEES